MVASQFLSRLFHQTPHHRQPSPQRQPPPQPQRPQYPPQSQPALESPGPPANHATAPPSAVPVWNPVAYWSRAVFESAGIEGSTCQTHSQLTDARYLPVLPPNYRSFYSALGDRNQPNDSPLHILPQSQSPIFTRFPLEIRQLIYSFTFGNRRIHLDYDFQPHRERWAWWHRICDEPQSCPAKEFICPENADAELSMLHLGSSDWVQPGFEYKLKAMGWLTSCKKGYQEALPILYASNTLVLTHGIDQLFRISRVMPKDHLALLTSLVVEIDVYRISKHPPDMEPRFQDFYQNVFNIIRVSLPSVRDLVFSIAGIPGPSNRTVEWSDRTESLWVGPWEELAKSRNWRNLEIAIPTSWLDHFTAVVDRRSHLVETMRYHLVKGVDVCPRGW